VSEDKVKLEITIPKNLYEKLKEKYEEAGFKDINEFIVFVLEQLLEETPGGETLTPEEEEKVKERLRALGYID